MSVSDEIRLWLDGEGVPVYGFADLTRLDPAVRQGFDRGIAIGLNYTAGALRDNRNGDPRRYYDEYLKINNRLPDLARGVESILIRNGYKAWAKVPASVAQNADLRSVLPHKTVATLSGIGWIGRCALLVTPAAGSALRLVVVLTDAPLVCGIPVTRSGCPADCRACIDVCPGHAPLGGTWTPQADRSSFFDAHACRAAARARAAAMLDIDETICGLCIAHCPISIRALGPGAD